MAYQKQGQGGPSQTRLYGDDDRGRGSVTSSRDGLGSRATPSGSHARDAQEGTLASRGDNQSRKDRRSRASSKRSVSRGFLSDSSVGSGSDLDTGSIGSFDGSLDGSFDGGSVGSMGSIGAIDPSLLEDATDVALQLISAGANVNAKHFDGRTPIFIACLKGRPSIVMALLRNGADPSIQPLWYASLSEMLQSACDDEVTLIRQGAIAKSKKKAARAEAEVTALLGAFQEARSALNARIDEIEVEARAAELKAFEEQTKAMSTRL